MFIRTDEVKSKGVGRKEVSVLHVMKEKTLNLEVIDVSHTLGGGVKKCVFIITDKAKSSRGGGKRCRCYERRRAKV